jgi:hypothetical protein
MVESSLLAPLAAHTMAKVVMMPSIPPYTILFRYSPPEEVDSLCDQPKPKQRERERASAGQTIGLS